MKLIEKEETINERKMEKKGKERKNNQVTVQK
jgi:hypothetical protein